jgi:hypothetical protein
MALTQMLLIQSLGEAMAWLERELNWGVPATELRHLCGRLGELYAAVITNGQMATEVNQKGYDVVGRDGERISVKTTAVAGSAGHVAFTAATLDLVDRIIVLRVNTDEMQIEILLDAPTAEVIPLLSEERDGKRNLSLGRLTSKIRGRGDLKALREVQHGGWTVRELENGTIEVEQEGACITPTKPALREIARDLGVGLTNSSGNPFNTRQLGSLIIKSLESS